MSRPVKTRTYRSPARAAQAERTRASILRAARELFTTVGYGCTMTQVADRAGVAVDTIYASVGRKPALVRAVIDMVLANEDEPVPAAQRGYVRQIREAEGARRKLEIYASSLAELLPVVAPLQEALRQAGHEDADCARAWSGLVERRAANMLLFARDLGGTGELRRDLSEQDVADIIWATNSAEYYLLLAGRGWSGDKFGAHLLDLWTRTLLSSGAAAD